MKDDARKAEINEEPSDGGFKVFDRRHWVDEDESGEAASEPERKPAYVAELEAKLAEKDQQLREYIAAYKQEVVQGLEEIKQRLGRDLEQQQKRLKGEVAVPLLEVLEVLERSIEAGATATDPQAILQGVKMVHMLMVQKLRDLGLERIPGVGHPFDPKVHEAVATVNVDDPAQHNVVQFEFSPGFVLGDQLVRPARVHVGKVQN